jgi:polar amino acid transport system substrate-binding protein
VLAGWWELASFVDAGGPVRIVGAPLYYVPLSVAFDDRDARDTRRLLAAVSASVSDMHDDGTLAALSEKWFDGEDRTTASPPPSASPSPGT